ncbi:MAG: hypothetical protein ACRC1F_00380 [Metamycoplasmataceae bacterium]
MKLIKSKLLLPMIISMVALPAMTLISCSDNKLTPEESNEELFLVNQAAKIRYAPKIELTRDISIAEIDSSIINFNNIPQEDRNLFYEILNFEIPLVNSVDTKVHVKVSSKLDKEIFQTYYFNVSAAIVKNNFSITPMTEDDFQKAVNDVYFNEENFFTNLRDDISIRISQAADELDITLEKHDNGALKSIFDIPSEKQIFLNKLENFTSPTIIGRMNQLALQQGMKVKFIDVQRRGSISEAELNINIDFGPNSVFSIPPFRITSFSTKYFNTGEKLEIILAEKIKPTLLTGGLNDSIPFWDLYNHLSIRIPRDLDSDGEFIIGIDTSVVLPIPPLASELFEIEIEIFSKDFSDRINSKYKIQLRDVVNYEIGKIDFSAVKPLPLSTPEDQKNKMVMKWK